jgi:hypothetical protein
VPTGNIAGILKYSFREDAVQMKQSPGITWATAEEYRLFAQRREQRRGLFRSGIKEGKYPFTLGEEQAFGRDFQIEIVEIHFYSGCYFRK